MSERNNFLDRIIGEIEVHSVEGINDCFRNGVNPNDIFRGQPLIYELTSEYLRSPRFKECVLAFVNAGLQFEDKVLLALLLDDADSLLNFIHDDKYILEQRFTLRSAFTPLEDVTMLHICAEHNHVNCAKLLLTFNSDVNAKAGIDEFGFGGQTPIFHTVNQIHNNSFEMLKLLLEHNADLHHTIPGLVWGKGYEWETFIPAVNPINYSMMGLLPQMHRDVKVISSVITLLLKAAYNIEYVPNNVPNQYLQ